MFFLYQILLIILLIFSPLIIFFRIFKKKEDKKRYKEKFCFPSKKRINGNLIWFHGSSVGELLSILPLVQELEKNKSINQILITTSTLSSAQIFKKYNLKKTVHQFFPIDSIFFSYKFLNYWKPTIAIFIESEIWPSIFRVLNKKNINVENLNINNSINKNNTNENNTNERGIGESNVSIFFFSSVIMHYHLPLLFLQKIQNRYHQNQMSLKDLE